jgi:hypothetical protein
VDSIDAGDWGIDCFLELSLGDAGNRMRNLLTEGEKKRTSNRALTKNAVDDVSLSYDQAEKSSKMLRATASRKVRKC